MWCCCRVCQGDSADASSQPWPPSLERHTSCNSPPLPTPPDSRRHSPPSHGTVHAAANDRAAHGTDDVAFTNVPFVTFCEIHTSERKDPLNPPATTTVDPATTNAAAPCRGPNAATRVASTQVLAPSWETHTSAKLSAVPKPPIITSAPPPVAKLALPDRACHGTSEAPTSHSDVAATTQQ